MRLSYLIRNPIRHIKTDGGYVSIFRKVGFIGDSLSSGEHESFDGKEKGYWDYMEYSWGQFMARKCGFQALNFSRGGLTAKEFFDYIKINNPYCEENKCQCYVIALGVNDVHHLDDVYKDGGFGSIKDVDWENEDNNKISYIGQYVRIIQKLRKLEPKCRIFVVSTPKEKPETQLKKKYYSAISSFLNELPKYFEFLYVVDLRKHAPIYDRKFNKTFFCGGHMTAAGYKFTADMIATYMDYFIQKYPADFKQVAFIGKGIHNVNEKW